MGVFFLCLRKNDLIQKIGKEGIKANRKTVQKIMQKYKIQCRVKPKRAKKMAGESTLVVPNILEQNFKPNLKWVTDIIYLPFGDTMLYLSTILDLYNNEVIAYKVSENQTTQLVLDTLDIACQKRNTAGIILHGDQGCQYTSNAFSKSCQRKRHYHQHVQERKLL